MRIRVVVAHVVNQGKGGAIQTARAHVTGDIVIIQDADLEYDPSDIPTLIHPIVRGHADAVLGTRFGGSGVHRVLYFWHRVGNGVLTLFSNALTNLNVTDMETGYKAFTRPVFAGMHLTKCRFGIEPEIVARLAQMGRTCVRGTDQLLRPHIRRGEKDHVAGRYRGCMAHYARSIDLQRSATAVCRRSTADGRPSAKRVTHDGSGTRRACAAVTTAVPRAR